MRWQIVYLLRDFVVAPHTFLRPKPRDTATPPAVGATLAAMEAHDDDPSRFLLGLVAGGDSIRVRRADMLSVARAREAHAQAVIAAWTATQRTAAPPFVASWRVRWRRRLRSGLARAGR